MRSLTGQKRLLLDLRPLQPGFKAHLDRGIGRYTRNLYLELLKLLDPWQTLFYLQADLPNPDFAPHIKRVCHGVGPGLKPMLRTFMTYHVQSPWALKKISSQLDMVHFMSHLDAPAWLGQPSVLTVHDLIGQRFSRLYRQNRTSLRFKLERRLETICLYQAKHIIVPSQTTLNDVTDIYGINPERITIIAEAADPCLGPRQNQAELSSLLHAYGLAPDTPFFLYLGGIDQRKDLASLLRALEILQAQGLPHNLILAGSIKKDRQYPSLLSQINSAGLAESVHMPGFVADQDLCLLLSSCLAFVFPSVYEGFGLPPLEAMTCGAPVVAVKAGAVSEVVGSAGLLVPPSDPPALAQALAEVAGNKDLRQKLTAEGYKRAATFSWAKAARDTLAVYEKILKHV